MIEYPKLKEEIAKLKEERDGMLDYHKAVYESAREMNIEIKQLKIERDHFNAVSKDLESQVDFLKKSSVNGTQSIIELKDEIAKLKEEIKQDNKTLKSLDKAYWEIIEKDSEKEQQIEQLKSTLDEIKKRYDYLNNFQGIRPEWHNRVVEELGKLLAKHEEIQDGYTQADMKPLHEDKK